MDYQFTKHYTRDEARALLPQVRQWLRRMGVLRKKLAQADQRLESVIAGGDDIGGDLVNTSLKDFAEMRELLKEFQVREIFIKDLDRGLLDFPAIVGGREVFLCWEEDEEDIEFWHDIDSGFAGREPLGET